MGRLWQDTVFIRRFSVGCRKFYPRFLLQGGTMIRVEASSFQTLCFLHLLSIIVQSLTEESRKPDQDFKTPNQTDVQNQNQQFQFIIGEAAIVKFSEFL